MSKRTTSQQDWQKYVDRLVEVAPPFTPDVEARLRGLLRGGGEGMSR